MVEPISQLLLKKAPCFGPFGGLNMLKTPQFGCAGSKPHDAQPVAAGASDGHAVDQGVHGVGCEKLFYQLMRKTFVDWWPIYMYTYIFIAVSYSTRSI